MKTTKNNRAAVVASGLFVCGLFAVILVTACSETVNKPFGSEQGPAAAVDGGADQNTTEGAEQPETGSDLTFSYDLPEGWRWMEEGKLDAILDENSKNGVAPYVKLSPAGFPVGTEEDTKQYIKESYEKMMKSCDAQAEQGFEECDLHPKYEELQIDGTTVYVSMSTSQYWGGDTWASSFAFEKNGRSIRFVLYDQADQYADELKTIVNSFTWE